MTTSLLSSYLHFCLMPKTVWFSNPFVKRVLNKYYIQSFNISLWSCWCTSNGLQGLGIPGLSKEAAEKESLKRALAESCSSAHQVFHGEPPFFKGGAGAHDSFGADYGQSDLRATEEELEQAVRWTTEGFCVEALFGGSCSIWDHRVVGFALAWPK